GAPARIRATSPVVSSPPLLLATGARVLWLPDSATGVDILTQTTRQPPIDFTIILCNYVRTRDRDYPKSLMVVTRSPIVQSRHRMRCIPTDYRIYPASGPDLF